MKLRTYIGEAKTLARHGHELCTTPELFKAWSQNLGHEQVLTTFTSCGTVSRDRQAEIFSSFGTAPSNANNVVQVVRLDDDQIRQLAPHISRGA